ncbi:GMC family oxidoreductase N-terminal domain-containing protein [Nocardioides dongxiaopingii]|uniref:GMC family oxidoreductase N-terminal domain-containing protein n=1 Tax=Nocardioides dongxiaopingii TaxID=2576036 RepID=UPI0010C7713E|nr:GMC family oxidoreductase [Nocardioides dongxiaopingii]
MTYDVAVVGSGPGGAVTARECARRGLKVVVLEEGDHVEPGEVAPYSLEQMRRQYRHHGLTVALGRPPVAYTEAACVGGGSEVNSGLYHRPDPAVLAEWSARHAIDGLAAADLAPWSAVVEDRLSVGTPPGPMNAASDVLRRGADALGWDGFDVPRWARSETGGPGLVKQTMLRTYLVDAVAAGAEVRPRVRVERVRIERGRATGVVTDQGVVAADRVVVCGGAIQTPALLLRSGVRRNVGRGLSMHPTVKVLAQVDDDINDPADLATYQVKEFAPDMTLGGSAGRPGMIALGLSGTWERDHGLEADWRRQSVYYASIRSQGTGRVRVLPGVRDPLVTYALTRSDVAALRAGLGRLMLLLEAAGARLQVPSYVGAPRVDGASEIPAGAAGLSRANASVMTVHLCGTMAMGEDRRRSATDSFGRVHDVANLHVNDASLLPSAPGINPQGTLMAVAHRNVEHLLGGRG